MNNKTSIKTTPTTSTPTTSAPTTSKSPRSAAPVAKATSTYQPSKEEIAARAFEIYQREGGTDQDNWLRAERELMARGRH